MSRLGRVFRSLPLGVFISAAYVDIRCTKCDCECKSRNLGLLKNRLHNNIFLGHIRTRLYHDRLSVIYGSVSVLSTDPGYSHVKNTVGAQSVDGSGCWGLPPLFRPTT